MIRTAAILLATTVMVSADPLTDFSDWAWPRPEAQPLVSPVPPAPEPQVRDLTLPNPNLTPGVTVKITVQELCSKRWGTDRRMVTAKMKQQVFEAYGLSGDDDPACTPDSSGRRCEIDHLISRELGGADDVKNLWPQPYGTQPWNAVRKDQVENRLHKEVCAGRLPLAEAQRQIATDWRVPYRRYFGEPK